MAYKFAKQSEVKELESWCMDILHAVQEEVRDYFTFDIRLIGSGDKRLVTQNSDESFDWFGFFACNRNRPCYCTLYQA